MSPGVRKGLIVAVVHVALVTTLGAKLLVDRATRPRVWARVAPVDPDSPLRGRYVRLRLEGHGENIPRTEDESVTMIVRDQSLVFVAASRDTGLTARLTTRADGSEVAVLDQPLAFFIPEHVPDPSIRAPGEELWAEVTLPRRGAPRPIRLGVKKDGILSPLE
jgi:hypothetical protein